MTSKIGWKVEKAIAFCGDRLATHVLRGGRATATAVFVRWNLDGAIVFPCLLDIVNPACHRQHIFSLVPLRGDIQQLLLATPDYDHTDLLRSGAPVAPCADGCSRQMHSCIFSLQPTVNLARWTL